MAAAEMKSFETLFRPSLLKTEWMQKMEEERSAISQCAQSSRDLDRAVCFIQNFTYTLTMPLSLAASYVFLECGYELDEHPPSDFGRCVTVCGLNPLTRIGQRSFCVIGHLAGNLDGYLVGPTYFFDSDDILSSTSDQWTQKINERLSRGDWAIICLGTEKIDFQQENRGEQLATEVFSLEELVATVLRHSEIDIFPRDVNLDHLTRELWLQHLPKFLEKEFNGATVRSVVDFVFGFADQGMKYDRFDVCKLVLRILKFEPSSDFGALEIDITIEIGNCRKYIHNSIEMMMEAHLKQWEAQPKTERGSRPVTSIEQLQLETRVYVNKKITTWEEKRRMKFKDKSRIRKVVDMLKEKCDANDVSMEEVEGKERNTEGSVPQIFPGTQHQFNGQHASSFGSYPDSTNAFGQSHAPFADRYCSSNQPFQFNPFARHSFDFGARNRSRPQTSGYATGTTSRTHSTVGHGASFHIPPNGVAHGAGSRIGDGGLNGSQVQFGIGNSSGNTSQSQSHNQTTSFQFR